MGCVIYYQIFNIIWYQSKQN